MRSFTVALIKPDAVVDGLAGRVISNIEMLPLKITDMRWDRWTPSFAEMWYWDLRERSFFKGLVEFMSTGPLVALVLEAEHEDPRKAVDCWRTALGATDPMKAGPYTIRGMFSRKDGIIMHNAVHGSDGIDAARRELGLLRSRLGWETFASSINIVEV